MALGHFCGTGLGPMRFLSKKKARSGVGGNDPEELCRTVLAIAAGQLYVERSYIFGAFEMAPQLVTDVH